MVEIQSPAAEIRRGKKKKKVCIRKEITGQKYNGPLLHRAAITNAVFQDPHIPQTFLKTKSLSIHNSLTFSLQWLRSYYAYIDYAPILSSSILAELKIRLCSGGHVIHVHLNIGGL